MRMCGSCASGMRGTKGPGAGAVRVENGEEVDRELWVLLEELQERNQALAVENTALRSRTPTGAFMYGSQEDSLKTCPATHAINMC